MTHWSDDEQDRWYPSSGILAPAEVRRALASRPGWRVRADGLAREVRCRDFACARSLGDRLANEVSYYGRHPELAIHDDGRLVVSLVDSNHAGVTIADLRLADDADRVIEQHGQCREASLPLDVGVARFSGRDGAEQAFAEARDRDPGAGWMGEAAFVEVHRDGRIVIRGGVAGHYVDVDGDGDVIGRDTGIGAVVGAAFGLLLGPPAFAAGLVGGATVGGTVEAKRARAPAGAAVDAIREQVPEGSSAVVVVSDSGRVQAMFNALGEASETFEHYLLTPQTEAELRSALAQAPPSARPPRATDG
jgi:pterin-4a-carbinolamine dehydratase